MTFSLNAGLIVQALMIAVLVGVGRTVFQTSLKLGELGALFRAHEKSDGAFHDEVREELRDLRRGT